ncbi:MAG: PEGA domain-containing protein [Planctomycetota bacterium]|jgi:hypothetical protein
MMTAKTFSRLVCYQANCFVGLLFCLLLLSSGCVRKRMTFRTNPSGAMVYVDKQPIGLTPVSTNFTYYGTRNIEVVRDGYRTEKFLRKVHAPWYQIPPLDFVSDTLWPFEVRDERIIDVQMTPDPEIPNDALIASGEQMRLQSSQGVAITLPPTANPNAIPLANPAVAVPSYPNPYGTPYPPQPKQSTATWFRDLFFPYGAPLSFPSTDVSPGGGFRPPTQ